MRRTTTPTHTFTLDIDPTTITALNITYAQSGGSVNCCNAVDGNIILVKTLDDCTIGEDNVSVTLTQEETNQFTEDLTVEIQLHAMVGETSLVSDIIKVPCRKVLNDEVL